MKPILTGDWSGAIETATRRIVPALVATFVAGCAMAAWIHGLNNAIAAAYVRLLGLQAGDQASMHHQSAAAPLTATQQPLAALTVVRLRQMAREQMGAAARPGGRRIAQSTKAALIEALQK